MTLELEGKDLEALLKAVFIAGWVSESSDKEDKAALEALEQQVFRQALESGRSDLVEYDGDLDMHFINAATEETWVEDYIAPHDDEHLWESLQMELARRDFAEAYSEAEAEAMDDEERMELLTGFLRRYSGEFAESGLENLYLRED